MHVRVHKSVTLDVERRGSTRKRRSSAERLLRIALGEDACSSAQGWATHSLSPPLPLQALVRTRVEPKTFFANERTFLQWCAR